MEGLPRPTKSAKTASSVPMSSLTDMSNVALRHTFRFADARTLAAAECLKPRLAQVARAAVVEAVDKRHGGRLEPVPGCAWRLLGYVLFQTVQLADAGLSTQVRSTLFEDLIFGQVSK